MKYLLAVFAGLLLFSCSSDQTSRENQVKTIDSTLAVQKVKKFDSIIVYSYFYENLSNDFNIQVDFSRFTNVDEFHDSCVVRLNIVDQKSRNVIDTLIVHSNYYFAQVFKNCDNVLSYSTKVNKGRKIVDNNYGDIIVADVNFDAKDDVIIINDSGGNGGPLYSYFIQKTDKHFYLDTFLTDSMSFFPQEINHKMKTLSTHPTAVKEYWQTFQYDVINSKWTELSLRNQEN